MSSTNKHIKAFESEYDKDEKEIVVLTNDLSTGTGRAQKSVLWTASKSFLAYVDVKTNELYKSEGRIVQPLTDEEMKDKTVGIYRLKGSSIYRLKIRELIDKTVPEGGVPSFFNRFLLVDIMETDVENAKLIAVLEEYRKPVKIIDELMGEFELNKDLELFSGEISWLGKKVHVSLDADKDNKESCVAAIEVLKTLFKEQEQRGLEFATFAAEELVELANDWNEDAENEITVESFIKRASIVEVAVSLDGNFTIYYDDDDMFWEHVVTVYGNIEKGLNSASIEG